MIKDIDINETLVSNKIPFGEQNSKYFIGYKNDRKIEPLFMFHLRMSIYERDIHSAMW